MYEMTGFAGRLLGRYTFSSATILVLTITLMGACGDSNSPTAPLSENSPQLSALSSSTTAAASKSPDVVTKRMGCYDPTWHECVNTPPSGDPSPAAPGVFLGSGMTWTACTGTGGLDADGLDDFCEFQLAVAFRPLLATNPWDGALGRESYWAAKRSGSYVVIFYALAYYWDGGANSEWCQWDTTGGCQPHPGDAEWVEIKVQFVSSSQHWQLSSATMSQHHNVNTYTILEYPSKPGHYPRVWVARGKHANYKTRTDCNDGATIVDTDTCVGNVDDVRVEVWSGRNLGSSTNKYKNGVYSLSDPFGHSGYEEFWSTSLNFCGWDGQAAANGRSGCSRNTDYGDILLNRNF